MWTPQRGVPQAWWLVPRWQSVWRRNLATGATVAIVSVLVWALAGAAVGPAHAVAVGAPVTLGMLALLRTGGPPRQVGWPRWGRILTRANITLGIAVALAGSLVFGLSLGLADSLGSRTTDPVSPVDPITSWRRDSQYVLALAFSDEDRSARRSDYSPRIVRLRTSNRGTPASRPAR